MRSFALKYGGIIQITLKSRFAYFWDLLGTGFIFIIVMFVFVKLWTATFLSQGAQIEGFNLVQMIWYLLGTELIVMSMPYVHRVIEREIREGDVAVRLGKPYSFFLFHYSQCLGEQLVKGGLLLIIGLVVTGILVGRIHMTALQVMAISVSYFLASLLNFTYGFIIGICAFWFEDISGVYFILDRVKWLLGGFLLPLTLFPEPLRTITQHLPFQYFIYAPARLVVDFSWSKWGDTLMGQIFVLFVFLFIAFLLYGRGVKRLNVNGG